MENPLLNVHPKVANGFLQVVINILGSLLPNMIVPSELEVDSITQDQTCRDQIAQDDLYQYKTNFKTAKLGLKTCDFIRNNFKNFPSKLPVSFHVADQDFCVEPEATLKFYDNLVNLKTSPRKNFELKKYPNGYHSLRAEISPIKEEYLNNLKEFISSKM